MQRMKTYKSWRQHPVQKRAPQQNLCDYWRLLQMKPCKNIHYFPFQKKR
jgi:hypothetical protein